MSTDARLAPLVDQVNSAPCWVATRSAHRVEGVPSTRKKPPTPEQLAEAKALRDIFKARLKISGVSSQEQFAEKFGLGSQGNLSHYLAGRQPLHLEAAIKISEGLQCDIADFNP